MIELYQTPLNKTEKNAKINFISGDNVDFMYLNVAHFFALLEENIGHLTSDESVRTKIL